MNKITVKGLLNSLPVSVKDALLLSLLKTHYEHNWKDILIDLYLGISEEVDNTVKKKLDK